MAELKYNAITKKIIGASFEVHKFLGNGFQEVIYQRALAWEFGQNNLDYVREIEQSIFYKNLKDPIGKRRADFLVEKNPESAEYPKGSDAGLFGEILWRAFFLIAHLPAVTSYAKLTQPRP